MDYSTAAYTSGCIAACLTLEKTAAAPSSSLRNALLGGAGGGLLGGVGGYNIDDENKVRNALIGSLGGALLGGAGGALNTKKIRNIEKIDPRKRPPPADVKKAEPKVTSKKSLEDFLERLRQEDIERLTKSPSERAGSFLDDL